MSEELLVDMGKFIVSKDDAILVSLGLGSCVGVAIYDPAKKIAGLAHVMLPNYDDSHQNSDCLNENKYANKAIPNMIAELENIGADRSTLKAKMAGGAHMFSTLQSSETLDIGKRNVEAVKEILHTEHIPLLADETGGSVGRTVRFEVMTLVYHVKTKDGLKDI